MIGMIVLAVCVQAVPVSPQRLLFACVVRVLQLVSEIATQSVSEEKLLSHQKEAAERFGFFQRTRNALSDLFGMLREKVRRSALGSFFVLG